MPFDLGHYAVRLVSPFNSESRFYWPAVIAVAVALAAHIVWYNWRQRAQAAPAEDAARPWAFWINLVFLVWITVLLMAKVPFYVFALSLAVNAVVLVYIYGYWLPPREAAWVREKRRLRYIPQPKRRRRR